MKKQNTHVEFDGVEVPLRRGRAAEKARAVPEPVNEEVDPPVKREKPIRREHPYAPIPPKVPVVAGPSNAPPLQPSNAPSQPVPPVVPPPVDHSKKAYRNVIPVHSEHVAENVFNRTLDSNITITQRELLSLSPEVRNQYREATATKRVATEENTNFVEALPFSSDVPPPPPSRSNVAPVIDPVMLQGIHEPGVFPENMRVAKESAALRALHALIDDSEQVECLIDPGASIVAISDHLCFHLGLPFDPSVTLELTSANGTVDQSLGLARNVPFNCGGMAVYLQAHVLPSPAYDVLLGRPFDILTESIVRNFADESQTIELTDPNTGERTSIPTLPRGAVRFRNRGHRH